MSHDKLLLGKTTDYPQRYAPETLFPIARSEGRAAVGIAGALPFCGVDVWTHYEVSWLDAQGKPRVAIAEIVVPADSPSLVESKSMKLYFNSLNFERFDSATAFLACVTRDLTAAAGAPVQVTLLPHEAGDGTLVRLPGECLDELPLACDAFEVDPGFLRADPQRVISETLHSHLLRSRCPVTHQPDWASVLVEYEGPALDRTGLLAYLVSYRNHADFHEQCVERIFMDVMQRCAPLQLTVYARYTRRGGLDINPWRSTRETLPYRLRLARQ
ncbi:MAG: queF [Moraxellaceae bacterium]|nr:queF [Moraxellaceae bacterium]